MRPHLGKAWRFLPKQSAEFIHHMEDVLEVYKRPRDLTRHKKSPKALPSGFSFDWRQITAC